MGILKSILIKDPKTPVEGYGPRIKNIIKYHSRGIFGTLLTICLICWQPVKGQNDTMVKSMWIWMFIFWLIQPINIPCTGFIPIFFLPMTGVMTSKDVAACYFNDNIALMILSGMVILLPNLSGWDKRMVLKFLCSGDNCQFSGKRLVFKASTAAFFLSMFCNRLIVTSVIVQYLTPAYQSLQSSTSRYRNSEPDYDKMRCIVLNAVQTSSAIGSTAVLHSAYATITFRAIFESSAGAANQFPDILNFLQYSFFAFPIAFLMYILNMCYHMLLINWITEKPMSASSMTEMRNSILKYRNALPRFASTHEKLSLIGTVLFLVFLFFRWNRFGWSWAGFNKWTDDVPKVKDATVAAIFVFILHVLPKSSGWVDVLSATKKSEFGSKKPDSSILWWRFVDRNTNYGYIFLMGSGVALNLAVQAFLKESVKGWGDFITSKSWIAAVLLIVIISTILANIMSGVAACCAFLPFVLNMVTGEEWPKHVYLWALAVGTASSYGFSIPFLYTPAYFCHYAGKVPIKKMIKYSVVTNIICIILLWLAICFWAPIIFDPSFNGIEPITVYVPPPAAGGGEEGGGGGEEAPPPEE